MKKYLLVFSLSFISLAVLSQSSFQLFDHDNNEIVQDQNIFIYMEDLSVAEYVSPELFLKNITSEELYVKCLRTVIEDVDNTLNFFCALGQCMDPSFDETPMDTAFANTLLVDQAFSAHYMPMNQNGTIKISYKYYDINNEDDFISFTVTFSDSPQSLGELENHSVTVYPNPVNNMLKVQFTNNNYMNSDFVIFDVLGNQVMNLKAKSEMSIDVSILKAGVYYYQVKGSKVVKGSFLKE
jgi:hypothetical protein